MRRRGIRPNRERGFALLIVLWSMVLLALIVAQLGAGGRTEARIARNLVDNARMEAAVDGAVFTAVFRATDPARPWPADGTPRQVEIGGLKVVVSVREEAGKIDPNTAPPALLEALFAAAGVEAGRAHMLARNVAEWRGGRSAVTPDERAAAYRAAGLPYAPPGRPFLRLDELGLVLGMTPADYAAVAPHLTLAHSGPPDPSRADAVVRRALATAGMRGPVLAAPSAAPAPARAISVTARAAGPEGAAFTRRAVFRFGATGWAPGGYAILAWDAVPD